MSSISILTTILIHLFVMFCILVYVYVQAEIDNTYLTKKLDELEKHIKNK